MILFSDLPLEILPLILAHLVKAQHVALVCLVNKSFNHFATPRLYERISIYAWHRDGKTKIIKLFQTLSRCSNLANHVRRLELRDFPKVMTNPNIDFINPVLIGLGNCINLRSCTWTRDGSLTAEILKILQDCKELRELEINGHSDGQYNPRLLLGLTNLSKVSIIMPSSALVTQLNPWMSLTGRTLRSLTIICKTSPFVTDDVLKSLAPHLVHLDHLHLTGCSKVSHLGVWEVISSNETGIVGLSLEGVSTKFDMTWFARICANSKILDKLRSVTLTVHQHLNMQQWMADVLLLLSSAPLEIFQIYSTGAIFESQTTDEFWRSFVEIHGLRLYRLSIHRMLISLNAINNISTRCTALEQLFVVVEPNSLDELAVRLSHAKRLRTVHVNYPLDATADTLPVLSPSKALEVIRRCSPTITQFGCNTRVWQVGRAIERHPSGILTSQPVLSAYESPDIPEPFLVVRI